MICVECGEEFWLDPNGVAHHLGDTLDNIDHDADADHVAYGKSSRERAEACPDHWTGHPVLVNEDTDTWECSSCLNDERLLRKWED